MTEPNRTIPVYLKERYQLMLFKTKSGDRWEVREVRTNYIMAVARTAKDAMKEFKEKMKVTQRNAHRTVTVSSTNQCPKCGRTDVRDNNLEMICNDCGHEWNQVDLENERAAKAIQEGAD